MFLVQISTISAQEVPVEEDSIDSIRAFERTLTLEGAAAETTQIEGPSIWIVVRMVLTLALVAAAVYGIVFLIKKTSGKNDTKDPFLKVLATAQLGSNRYAHVVSVGSKAWLLGSSDGGVNLIGEIEDRDILNAMLLEDSRKSASATNGRFPDFMAILRRLGMPADTRVSGADDIRKRRERLKGL
ncbi:MAG: flagellar biosynthetic protein FliO [Treponema sp.]|nr:flagellar biosynthetic protein FliO [Treponema sp.]